MVPVGSRCWAVSLCLALFGCASDGTLVDVDDRPGASYAGATSQPTCVLGTQCDCDDGDYGYMLCEPASCQCPPCPTFKPDVLPEFQSCAGDVLGDWTLESAEFQAEPRVFMANRDEDFVTCPAQLAAAPADFKLNLSVPSKARARLEMSEFAFNARFLDSCSKPILGFNCGNGPSSEGGPCHAVGCGACECPSTVFSATRSESLQLRLDDATLSIAGMDLQYCVDGDHLTLSGHGLTAKLRKVAFVGTPVACESRDAANCELGWFGTGCKWAAGKCSGSVPLRCQIEDYGHVPGCAVYEADAACVLLKAPENCADHDQAECAATTGCVWPNSCSGPDIDCNVLWLRSGICDTDGGCTKIDNDVCMGTAECMKHTSQVPCQELNQCAWGGCRAVKSVPCQDYPLSECTEHEECEIVGTRRKD